MRKLSAAVALLIIALAGLAWATRPAALDPDVARRTLPDDLESYLRDSERVADARVGIIPGTEKRIVWAGEQGARTGRALIYLHGFSATRQEIAPVPELVARALGANLYEARLAGHGQEREPVSGVPAEAWLADGAEALAIGRALGERLIIIGTSTGATLALAMARHADFAAVESLVLLSPNWGPAAAGSEMATGPFGPQLTRLLAGEWHAWDPVNAQQEQYWTTRYPTSSIVEMMRLVDLARALTPAATVGNALLIYSPRDDVVSVDKLLAGFDALPAARKEIVRIDQPRSLSTHVFTGDILAPESTADMAATISAFLQN